MSTKKAPSTYSSSYAVNYSHTLLTNGEQLAGISTASSLIQTPTCVRNETNSTITILRLESQARLPSSKGEKLGVRHCPLPISPTTTREHNDRITSSAAIVEVQTSIGETADNKGGIGSIIMLAGCDEVEFRIGAAIARFELDGDQVLAEIARGRVDEEALAVGGLDLDAGEGARRGVVEDVGFCGCRRVEDAACAGHGDD